MKGDIEIYVVAFVLLIVFVFIIAVAFFGNKNQLQTKTLGSVSEITYCKNDNDCEGNSQGIKCLLTYPGDYVPFCGCLTDADCNVGKCGANSKCS